jgi:hypothetical protein
MKFSIGLLVVMLLSYMGMAQDLVPPHASQSMPGTWDVLNRVEVNNTASGGFVATFAKEIKELEGKKIELKGYMIPITQTAQHSYFILSALPANACFFHGEGGPGTVIEVNSLKPVAHSYDRIVMRGILRLNKDNDEHMVFILDKAEMVPVK